MERNRIEESSSNKQNEPPKARRELFQQLSLEEQKAQIEREREKTSDVIATAFSNDPSLTNGLEGIEELARKHKLNAEEMGLRGVSIDYIEKFARAIKGKSYISALNARDGLEFRLWREIPDIRSLEGDHADWTANESIGLAQAEEATLEKAIEIIRKLNGKSIITKILIDGGRYVEGERGVYEIDTSEKK